MSAATCQTIGGRACFSKTAGTESEGESAVILSIKCHFNQFYYITRQIFSFPGGSVIKHLSGSAGGTRGTDSISGLGRSPAEGNGNPLQYSCL